jgi:energy-coupling factor transport system ATP-binding protein
LAPKNTQPLAQIGFKHVHFAYNRDAAPVLQDCTLELDAGKIHALVGGNGSGKSTALKLLAGVLKPAHGRVLASADARVAYLPQNVESLFVCDSVLEELMEWSGEGVFAARQLRRSSGASRANKRKRGGAQTAAYAQDEALELARAFGLETALDRHPFDLSGGEQRLLAIAKLLLLRPQLLLADEPTCGLDAPSRQAIAVVFKNMQVAGLTVVFATHDLNFAEGVASDISMIFDGQFSHPEPADEFFANNLFYKPAAVVDAATSAVDSRVASTLAVAATCTPASNIQVATN